MEHLIRKILKSIGENPEREGLKQTPARVAKMYEEIFKGYAEKPESVFKVFKSEHYDGLVIVKDIEFYSHCEHHMVPFFGKVHIGYKPNGKVIGISKTARLVEIFSRRLQIQERLTTQIREAIDKNLKSKGTAVIIEAKHLCMSMRGVQKKTALTVTSSYSGLLKKNPIYQQEFLNHIHNKSCS